MTDPRFDPAFQRGYSGPEPELVARQPPLVAAAVEPVAAGVPAVVPADPAGGPIAEQSPEPWAGPADTRPADDTPVSNGTDAFRNPYRMSLLVLGVILLLAAVTALYSQIQQPQAADTTPQSQFVHLLIGDLPPSLTVAGFVCVILWLALGALDRVESN